MNPYHPGKTQFEEIQAFALWVYLVMAVGLALSFETVITQPLLFTPLVVVLLLAANLLCERTTVDDEVVVSFGWLFPLYRRRIRLTEVASAEAVTYSALIEYGGWGIRGMGKNVALNARGNRGVRLHLQNGNRVLIGSQRPEELAAAIAAR